MDKRNPVYLVTILIGVYIALQMIADVTAVKIVEIAGITLPAGTFVFAVTFTWRDMLHKRLGKEWARAAIIAAAFINLGMVLYFAFVIDLPAAGFWGNQEALETILGVVPRIAVASILAELISELVDTEIYHRLAARIPEKHQYLRVLGSNGLSIPLDSIVFGTLAFAGVMDFSALLSLWVGQTVFKYIVASVSIPLVYLVKERKERLEFVSV